MSGGKTLVHRGHAGLLQIKWCHAAALRQISQLPVHRVVRRIEVVLASERASANERAQSHRVYGRAKHGKHASAGTVCDVATVVCVSCAAE